MLRLRGRSHLLQSAEHLGVSCSIHQAFVGSRVFYVLTSPRTFGRCGLHGLDKSMGDSDWVQRARRVFHQLMRQEVSVTVKECVRERRIYLVTLRDEQGVDARRSIAMYSGVQMYSPPGTPGTVNEREKKWVYLSSWSWAVIGEHQHSTVFFCSIS